MGRRVPNENNNITILIDPYLYFPFCMVGLAASIAIISALCVVRLRRKSSSTHAPMSHHDSHKVVVTNDLHACTTPPSINMEATTTSLEHEQQHPSTSDNTTQTQTQNNETLVKELLPLPPALQQHPNVDPKIMKRATTERRLSFNLSRKMPRSLSVARNWDHKGSSVGRRKGKLLKTDESMWVKTKAKMQKDDSVWMKTIILGGKCVPDEEEDAVIYEGKGKKISAYHPRNPSSVSLSRQWSSISHDHEERINICEEKK
uniref:Transmembrane protein n=1 Tax=Cajanus cajan TaxID=3821 RepID=A0A151QSQ8_CAJCA|nr:hypothetical protein KK1_045859 [Cajanus cajan]